MILATVRTCPRRWNEYQNLRKQFSALGFPFPLRTIQCPEHLDSPRANSILTARAALSYCDSHLAVNDDAWMLFLEDDVRVGLDLPRLLPELTRLGHEHGVDCWYLCNRKNRVKARWNWQDMTINELEYPIDGSHGLLLPKRHLRRILDWHWARRVDWCIFDAIRHSSVKVWQVIAPVLVEHIGEYSTFDHANRKRPEVCYGN